MYKIQTLNKISNTGLDLFFHADYEIASEFQNPDGIILRSYNMHDMTLPSNLKAVARAGAGVNNIPVDACTEKGIVVFNTPGANANSVKELVLTAMLLASRNIPSALDWTKTLHDKGDEVPRLVEKGKSQFTGNEISGKKLGIVGLGAIGVMVANAAHALGMTVMGFDPFITVDKAWELHYNISKSRSIDELISECDYIAVHVPLSDTTRGMFNRERFQLMKGNVVLLNFARGGLVNNADLREAFEQDRICAYVTDFPDEELLSTNGVICLPHLGASTVEAEENCAVMAASQLKEYLECGNITNSVNFPDCELPLSTDYRITIADKNIPNMVGQISHIIAEAGINIQDMVNKHRDNLAYNIINIGSPLSDADIDRLRKIDGVLNVRMFTQKSEKCI
ncbi:MAG: phosphoglycerate dehydrogenase [Spirochaetota bacterium]